MVNIPADLRLNRLQLLIVDFRLTVDCRAFSGLYAQLVSLSTASFGKGKLNPTVYEKII